VNTCPPGTEMSPITWIGTCTNPADGRAYVISYNGAAAPLRAGSACATAQRGRSPTSAPAVQQRLQLVPGLAEQRLQLLGGGRSASRWRKASEARGCARRGGRARRGRSAGDPSGGAA
jgi:hypothetical protein